MANPAVLFSLLAELLAPPRCAACDAILGRPAVFCSPCASTVVSQGPELGGGGSPLLAYGLYGGALADALRRLKYEGRPELARPLGDLLRSRIRGRLPGIDWVVPVPLHPRRLVERGYNQAALLGRPVARELGAKLLARALERTRNTPMQAHLSRGERLHNLEGAFRVGSRARTRLGGRRVALVDDVATTGATLAACREALVAAGASVALSIVVARAE